MMIQLRKYIQQHCEMIKCICGQQHCMQQSFIEHNHEQKSGQFYTVQTMIYLITHFSESISIFQQNCSQIITNIFQKYKHQLPLFKIQYSLIQSALFHQIQIYHSTFHNISKITGNQIYQIVSKLKSNQLKFIIQQQYFISLFSKPSTSQNYHNLLYSQQFVQILINLFPQSSILYMQLADIQYQFKKYQQALQNYNKSINNDRRNIKCVIKKGSLLIFQLKRYKQGQELLKNRLEQKGDDNLNIYNLLGILYNKIKKYGESQFYFKKITDQSSNYPSINYNMANLYANMGQYQKAQKYYKLAISINPNYSKPYNNYANILQKFNRNLQAIHYYTQAISFNSNYFQAYLNRAILYYKINFFHLSKIDLDFLISNKHQTSKSYLHRILTNIKLNLFSQAQQDFKILKLLNPSSYLYQIGGHLYQITNRIQQAIQNYTQSLKLDQKNIKVMVLRGNIYKKISQYELALKDYNLAQETEKYQKNYLKINFYRGQIFMKLNRLEEAIKEFMIDIEKNPRNYRAYYNLAEIYEQKNELSLAQKMYDKILLYNKKQGQAYIKRGKLYKLNGRRTQAIKDFNEGIKHNVNNISKQFLFEAAQFIQKINFNEALPFYIQIIKLKPDYYNAYLSIAQIYFIQSKYEIAITYYDKYISYSQANHKAYFKRAKSFTQLNKLIEALYDYTNSIKLNPFNNQAFLQRGIINFKLGFYEDAKFDFLNIVSTDPLYLNENRYYYLGLVYLREQKFELASQNFGLAIDVSTNFNKRHQYYLYKAIALEKNERISEQDYQNAFNIGFMSRYEAMDKLRIVYRQFYGKKKY